MELKIDRKWKKSSYCIGNLYVDGQMFCNTAEDTDRGLDSSMTESEIAKIKIKDHTAIPTGTYEIDMDTVSPRFGSQSFYKTYANGGKVPRLKDVKGFSGILIHTGNSPDPDSSGCVLIGENTQVGKVLNSKETFKKLYPVLQKAHENGEKITLTII